MLVLSAGLGGCINTATYGTGEAPEVTVVKGATSGLTGIGGKKQEIEYRPRAPLVMPPENNLRPPGTTATAAVDPDWPDDGRNRQRVEVEDPLGETSRDNKAYRDSLPQITPQTVERRQLGYDEDKFGARAHVDAVREKQARKEFEAALEEANGYDSSQGRQYLTDPPDSYRKPAESAQQEFEDIEAAEGSGFAKWMNVFKRPPQ